jgi:hypothetical protein
MAVGSEPADQLGATRFAATRVKFRIILQLSDKRQNFVRFAVQSMMVSGA